MKTSQPGATAAHVTDRESERRDRPRRSLIGRRGLEFGALDPLTSIGPNLGASLTTLGASAEMLVESLDQLDTQRIGEVAGSIHRRALRLQAQVENLLCATTIREGRFRVRPGPFNVVELVAEVMAIAEPLAAAKAQPLRLSVRGARRDVPGDRQRIAQVLINLLSNACRYADPGTPIDVAVASPGDRVRVTVSDRGPGLPAGGAASLFDPSRRRANASGLDAEGLGLGLAVAGSIVEAHGGRMGAASRSGGGARIWFELPAAALSAGVGR